MSADLNGAALIAAERQRQIDSEGWTPEHDAEHQTGALADAAAMYAASHHVRYPTGVPAGCSALPAPFAWPWHTSWWKPSPDDRVRELVKAGALIAAEIDRLSAPQTRSDQ